MTTIDLNTTQSALTFFQQRVIRSVEYWLEHDAVKQLKIAYLDKEREAILKAISMGLQFGPAWPVVRALINALTSYMERRGHWDAWHQLLQRAIGVAQRVGDSDGEVTLTALLARLSQRMSRPEDVVRYYRRVIRLARQTGNKYELARACSNLGFLYIDGGYWWRSRVLSFYALTIFKDLNSEHGQAHTNNHLGVLFTRERQFGLAEQHLQAACNAWERIDDEHGLLRGYINIGLLYLDMVQPYDALRVLTIALNLAEKTGEMHEIGTVQNNIGLANILTNEYEKAERHLVLAKKIFTTARNPEMLARVHQNIGRIHFRKNEWEAAGLALDLALKTIRLTSAVEAEIGIRFDLAEFAVSQSNFSSASAQFEELEKTISLHTAGMLQDFYRELLQNLRLKITNH